jgi:hypothetical protein
LKVTGKKATKMLGELDEDHLRYVLQHGTDIERDAAQVVLAHDSPAK